MRAANLYLIPVGVALAAVLAAVIAFGMRAGMITWIDPATFERGLVVLVMAVWPAVAWLSSRGRDAQALAVAGTVGIVALGGPGVTADDRFCGRRGGGGSDDRIPPVW